MSLRELPPEIGILSQRTIVPVMASLSEVRHFGFLQAEALATALVLGAGLQVTVASDALRSGCATLDVALNVVSL